MSDRSLRERLVGGIQWAVSAWYLLTVGFVALGLYLQATRTEYGVAFDWEVFALVGGAFLVGAAWVGWRGPVTPSAHRRRIETILGLFVVGFGLQIVGAVAINAVSGFSIVSSMATYGATTLASLVIVYGVAYGLDVRVLFSPDGATPRGATDQSAGETAPETGTDGK